MHEAGVLKIEHVIREEDISVKGEVKGYGEYGDESVVKVRNEVVGNRRI